MYMDNFYTYYIHDPMCNINTSYWNYNYIYNNFYINYICVLQST